MTIELDSTLAQAEVLFLSFAQLIADIDRRKAEEISASSSNLRRRATLGSKSAGSISSIEGAEAEKKAGESKIQEVDDAKKDEDTKKDGDAKKDDDANADKAEGKKVPAVNLPVISDNLRDLLKAGR